MFANTDAVPQSRTSFTNLSRWLADAKALASPHLVTVLVGNKSDREDDREVEWSEASRWAAQNGAHVVPNSPIKECLRALNRRALPGGVIIDGR